MSGILIAFFANGLLGLSLVFDKIFLGRRETGHAFTYVFWIGVLNVFGFILLPFGFSLPPLPLVLLALAAGAIFFFALLAYYMALKVGEASQTLAIVGGFAPLATLLIGNLLSLEPLNIAEKVAFGFLVCGGFLMFFTERLNVKKIFLLVLLASILFGLGNVLQKIVFTNTNFATGFVLTKFGTFLTPLLLLTIPHLRRDVFSRSKDAPPPHRILYFGNRLLAGIATLLIFYAVSLTHPALVEAIGGFRYVLIFLLAWGMTIFSPRWLRENFKGWILFVKIAATLLIIIGLLGLGLQMYYSQKPIPPPEKISWGVTFSPLMSERLGLNWQENYRAILEELRPAGIRLVAYWPTVEPENDTWDFQDLDWQMEEAKRANIPVILTVGQKVPRWPECHYPQWLLRQFSIPPPKADPPPAGTFQLQNEAARVTLEKELFQYLRVVVSRYREYPNLLYWQVENEPFLPFGECPSPDPGLLDTEGGLVKKLDPHHPILMTDGGEFGDWYRAARRADIFGTTLYRKVYNNTFGHITYPLTPEFYPLKSDVVRRLSGNPRQKFISIEVGMEPWTKKQVYEIPLEEQLRLFTIQDFKDTIVYARASRFDAHFLWGAEWWYSLKTKHNIPDYWEEATSVIASGKR